jgi:hypothetical protein
MLFLNALPIFVALLLESFTHNAPGAHMPLWVYAIAQSGPLLTGTQIMTSTLDVFVPLTGRTGRDAPADHVVASIVAIIGSYTMPLFPAFVHRFANARHSGFGGRARGLGGALIVSIALTTLAMAIFAMREPFDQMHQKRLFVIHMQNVGLWLFRVCRVSDLLKPFRRQRKKSICILLPQTPLRDSMNW